MFLIRFLVLFIFIATTLGADSSGDFFDAFIKAKQEKRPLLSLIDQRKDYSGNVYDFQRRWVNELMKKHSKKGFKVGLTNSSSQKKYNVSSPIFGVLVPELPLNNFSRVPLANFHNLYLEIELGVRLKRSVKKPIESNSQLKFYIQDFVPVIEFVDLPFKTLSTISYKDLIMANAGAFSYIIGRPINLDDLTLHPIRFLQQSSEIDSVVFSSAVKSSLYKNLKFAINSALANGWKVKKGDLILTGSLGKMHVAQKGRYLANFAKTSSIMFDIY